MNRYPLWKNLLIAVVLALGVLYAWPNLYTPDPAIQITGASGGTAMNQQVMDKVKTALIGAGIEYFGEQNQGTSILLRLHTPDKQLSAKTVVEAALGSEYVVALNLAQNTPGWLTAIGAKPMKLGLDLSGGVHFLLEVDTSKLISVRLESDLDQLRIKAKEAKIAADSWRGVVEQNALLISSADAAVRNQLNDIAGSELSGFVRKSIDKDGVFQLQVSMSEPAVMELEKYAVGQNLTALRNRVNELGVSEPLVQVQGRNRIVVELPGVQDTAQAKRIIGKTANLEFRLEAGDNTLTSQRETFKFRDTPSRSAVLEKKLIVGGDRVTNARASFDQQSSQPEVNVTLDSEGGTMMHHATRDNIGNKMAVLFIERRTDTKDIVDANGVKTTTRVSHEEKGIISLATIQSALGVQFRITGLSSPQEANELALLLRAGALAAPVDFVEERTIGPSMGADNIKLGIKSIKVSMLLIAVFMVLAYRLFGGVAMVALAFNLVLLVALMSIVGATLTMPGIAGIVLSLGMAVDANVLIYARISEEWKRNALAPAAAINAGFDRAFLTILDSHVTIVLVGVILGIIGTGPIQGFAVTLTIGIVASMFTGVMVTRAQVNAIYGGRQPKTLWI